MIKKQWIWIALAIGTAACGQDDATEPGTLTLRGDGVTIESVRLAAGIDTLVTRDTDGEVLVELTYDATLHSAVIDGAGTSQSVDIHHLPRPLSLEAASQLAYATFQSGGTSPSAGPLCCWWGDADECGWIWEHGPMVCCGYVGYDCEFGP